MAQLDDPLGEHGVGQLLDEPGVLGDSDEVGRGDLAAGVVVPADERLGARDQPTREVELGLVGHGEFSVVE